MYEINRRQFIKSGMGAVAGLVVGSGMPWNFGNKAYAAVQELNFTITDAIKDMATHNILNQGQCYFWVFKEANVPAEVPGPHIFIVQGDTIQLTVTNTLDERHAWSVPGLEFTTGPIDPGETVVTSFEATRAGTFLYYDDLNEPVNRVMGLHGAFVVMPAQAAEGHKFTPYDNPAPRVQQLFDDLGSTPWWPGLSWQDGNAATNTEPFRQYIWLLHQASPNLFAEVGDYTPGQEYPANDFVEKFLHDPFSATNANNIPQYFTISGQAGHFSHNTPYINPNRRVGEPVHVRLLNAGLWTHSMHLHANHFYVTDVRNAAASVLDTAGPGNPSDSGPPVDPGGGGGGSGSGSGSGSGGGAGGGIGSANGGGGSGGGCFIQTLGGNEDTFIPFASSEEGNLLWLDVFTIGPMDIVDYFIPFHRPPDVPNVRGIGRADAGLPTVTGGTTWPPNEELATVLPSDLTGLDQQGGIISLATELSPMCYPMHDHSEPSQTSQGGNYNMGMIAGMNFIGDHSDPNNPISFPNQPVVFPPGPLGAFVPAVNPPWFDHS